MQTRNRTTRIIKDRIKKLAQDIDETGIVPTVMICGLISNKLTGIFPNHNYVIHVLDSKYKNQNHQSNNNNNNSTTTAAVSTSTVVDYGATFDVSDCSIELWSTYSDGWPSEHLLIEYFYTLLLTAQ